MKIKMKPNILNIWKKHNMSQDYSIKMAIYNGKKEYTT